MVMDNSQSTSRVYRICAHALITGGISILALYLKGMSSISLFAILAILLITTFICTLFISFHADAADGIQILFLYKEEFDKRKDNSGV